MANVAIDTNSLTTISACEAITGWSGVDTLDPDIKLQGSNSLTGTISGTGINDDLYYDLGSGGTDLSGEHIRMWMTSTLTAYMDTAAQNGMRLFIEDTSSNRSYWNLGGSDTYFGGWMNICAYIGSPDTDGSLVETAVRYIGIEFNLAVRPKNIDNIWVDYLRYGDGLVCNSDATDAQFTMDDIYLEDQANGYGIVEKINDVYFLSGSLTFQEFTGETSTANVLFDNSVVVFTDKNVSTTLYAIDRVGDASDKFVLTNSVVASAGPSFSIDLGTTHHANNEIDGCTIKGAQGGITANNFPITNNVFSNCGIIEPNLGEFTGNTIGTISSTHALEMILSHDISDCTINLETGDYGILIDTVGTYSMEGMVFTGGLKDVEVTATTGTVIINVVGGGASPTYDTDGATVTVNNSVDFTFTLVPSITDYEWRIYSVTATGSMAGASELDGEETATADNQEYLYNYTADTPIAVQIISQPDEDYEEITNYYTLTSSTQDVTINLRKDENN